MSYENNTIIPCIMNEQEIIKYYANKLEKHRNSPFSCFFSPNASLVSIDDWQLCYKNGIDLASTDIYCESGKRTHDRVRESYNCRVVGIRPTYDNENERQKHLDDTIGLKTPRKGFYKIINISEDGKMLNCYYNFKRGNAFLDEIVEINRKPFYNNASVGPKQDIIQVNDIIEVKDTDLVDIEYDGLPDKAYRIIWDFIM